MTGVCRVKYKMHNDWCVCRVKHKMLLKPCFPPQTNHSLRNHDGPSFVIPQARTESYLNSFYHQPLTCGMTYHCISEVSQHYLLSQML